MLKSKFLLVKTEYQIFFYKIFKFILNAFDEILSQLAPPVGSPAARYPRAAFLIKLSGYIYKKLVTISLSTFMMTPRLSKSQ